MRQFLLLLLLPSAISAQDISGLWTGSLYNDTTKTSLHYEVAISEKNGKYSGFSYTTFLINNKEYVGVKSLKVVKSKEQYFFEDEELLYNNYPVAPPKGVKQISALDYIENDTSRILSGKFITTRTKQYGRQVTGTVQLQREKDVAGDKLVALLQSLKLADQLSFMAPPVEQKTVVANVGEPTTLPSKASGSVPLVKKIDPIEELARRKVETIQTVLFTADSLKITLYDNGYVDGDSVSIIVDGKLLLEHQRLSTQPITKTIKPSTGVDSVSLIMYAENLGSIAPNTGLLIIEDGEKRHEITFSGDLQKNASILLKRKK